MTQKFFIIILSLFSMLFPCAPKTIADDGINYYGLELKLKVAKPEILVYYTVAVGDTARSIVFKNNTNDKIIKIQLDKNDADRLKLNFYKIYFGNDSLVKTRIYTGAMLSATRSKLLVDIYHNGKNIVDMTSLSDWTDNYDLVFTETFQEIADILYKYEQEYISVRRERIEKIIPPVQTKTGKRLKKQSDQEEVNNIK